MTPIAWVVEHSLQASERFRHLTVMNETYFEWLYREAGRRAAETLIEQFKDGGIDLMEDFK